MKSKVLTLCIVREGSKVLLGLKKRGFGVGRWNGFGGKIDKGETIEKAAKREIFEEAGIEVKDLEKVGILEFKFKSSGDIFETHIFCTENYSGEPTESEEMKPAWFETDKLPFKKMWPDDFYWYPLFLAGKKFVGEFLFGPGEVVLEYKLKEVNKLPHGQENT
jgi:8-oxo-dGTP diphosphatase / 2-hydroxy-dATP diphosphatase